MREKENLTLLGNQQNNYETDYNPGLLETFVNKHPENDYFVKFNCPEFTSLCQLQGSLISQTLLFRMSQAREWWKARA